MDLIRFYLDDVGKLIREIPVEKVEDWYQRLVTAYDEGRQVFLMGNGGSAANCSHIVNDFQKCIYLAGNKPFRCMSLTDQIPLITAWSNDVGYEVIFAEQLRPWVQEGDLVLCVSGSGNSPNVLNAVKLAKEHGATVLGFCGFQGGKLAPMCDDALVVPSDNMQRIEDVHMIVLHVLFWRMLQEVESRAGGANG